MSRRDHTHHHEDDEDESSMIPTALPLFGKTIISYDLFQQRFKNATHVVLDLDGKALSTLNWDGSFQKAKDVLSKGYQILFHLDLGLFDVLAHPLHHPGQFQALKLSCSHFRKTAVEQFGDSLLGVILYQGPFPLKPAKTHLLSNSLPNFHDWLQSRDTTSDLPHSMAEILASPEMSWNYTRFCHEECIEYLRLLSFEIPDTLHRFALFDIQPELDPASILLHSARDLLDPIHPVLCYHNKDAFPFHISASILDSNVKSMEAYFCQNQFPLFQPQFQAETDCLSAILLPAYSSCAYTKLTPLMKELNLISLKKDTQEMKVVHEPFFTTEWHGIDRVLVSKQTLSPEGIRTLRGFTAAGGEIFDVDEKKGV